MSRAKNRANDDSSSIVAGEMRTPQKGAALPKLHFSNENVEIEAPDQLDLVCLSHLRWDFVYQRPQHLLSRCAQKQRVFIIEEPIFGPNSKARLDVTRRESGVWVVVPHLLEGLSEDAANTAQQALIDDLFAEYEIRQYIFWYYTPMAMAFTRHLKPKVVVYDCMDQLSAFKGAPPALREREAELFSRADLVFTGGQSLYEAKRDQHPNVHAFPSSIDKAHFAQARNFTQDPADQADIPHPRLGFFGVIDERMDIDLLGGIAEARPDWHLVIIGPVVKIDLQSLPRPQNIHYLGGKSYQELPEYLAGWDVALLPFARNESTRFISPTKTPEYLAAGKPVVSTSICDVVRPYGQQGLVRIADTVAEFVAAAESVMNEIDKSEWLCQVDAFLAQNSWDLTWARMKQLVESAMGGGVASAKENHAESQSHEGGVRSAQSKGAASASPEVSASHGSSRRGATTANSTKRTVVKQSQVTALPDATIPG